MSLPPSPKDVSEMARLMAILEGRAPPASPAAVPVVRNGRPVAPRAPEVYAPPTPGTADAASVDAMRNLLERFHAATDGAARTAVIEGKRDPLLREAMMMEETSAGLRIGEWDVVVRENGGRKLFDVVKDGDRIAADLTLYEAALGIVRALNAGKFINGTEVRSILMDEQDYAQSLHDAILFKKRLTESRDSSKRDIHEARYGEARRRAIQARERIKARVADLDH